jgi:hypothetical protein
MPMTISVHEDESETGGFAFVALGRRVAPPLLSLRRLDTEPRHLGLGGWQPEVAWLAPLSVEEQDGSTVVRFGPQVVDCIEELVPIEFVVQDGTSLGTVVWPFITPAPTGRRLLVVEAAPAPALVQISAEPPPQEASPPPPPHLPIAPEPPPFVPPTRTAAANTVELPRRRGYGWLVALLLLAVAGGAGAWQWDRIMAMIRPPAPVVEAAIPAPAEPAQAPASPPAPPSEPVTPLRSRVELIQQHDRLLRERAAPAAFVELGTSALSARQGSVAFRAFEEADPAANQDAAWQLARFYDPRNTEAAYRETVEPNAARAAYYYALWRNRSARHTEELRALCAANGDAAGRDEHLRTLCQP